MTTLELNEANYDLTLAPEARDPQAVDRRQRFMRERFGIFIHFGISATLEGWWQGEQYEGLAEWIQQGKKIPLAAYRSLAERFQLEQFDADAFARQLRPMRSRWRSMRSRMSFLYVICHRDISPV